MYKFVLKISQYSIFTRIQRCLSLFLIKETPTQVFSCAYCEIIKNNYFVKYLRTTAPVWPKYQTICKNLEFYIYIYTKYMYKYTTKSVTDLSE